MTPTLPADLAGFLSSTQLFQPISLSAVREIAAKLQLIAVRCGGLLIPEGASDDDLYVILAGTVAVTTRDSAGMIRFLTALGPGETAGEWMTGGSDSAAELTAIEDTVAGRLPPADFDLFAEQYPDDAAKIIQLLIRSLHRSRLLHALYLTQLFGDLDTVALRELEKELELVSFSSGQLIVRQGDPGDCAHVVVNGRVRVVSQNREGQDATIAELGIGEVIGEMALLTNEPRTATAYAIRDTQTARLSQASFERFLINHPRTALQVFTRNTVVRLVKQLSGSAAPEQSIRTVAVAPVERDVPLAEFATRFSTALSHLGSTLHLNAARVDSALGQLGAAQAPEVSTQNLRVVEWLNQRESEHKYVVYECDTSPTPWSRRCVRQADYILLIARAGADPMPGEAEAHLMNDYHANTSIRRSLVLLHSDDTRSPSDTAQWLALRNVHQHFHVRSNSTGDIDRIGRFLVGSAFGLALGGGFARGLVHIGVIRALEEAGIAIDAIGGNSMGAVIAAQWAQGWDGEMMLRRTAEGCGAWLKDMTLPVIAFKSGRRFSNLIRSFNGDKRIEDLWVPYFCVSANLNRAELKIHRQGPLAKAILASSRVPGVFPPIIYDGDMHIDGGILNNVPVDVMREVTNNGIVMGVDAAQNREFGSVPDYGFEMTGWQVLRKHVDIPNIAQIMLRTMEFGSVYRKRSLSSAADLYLRPTLSKFKATDFSMASEIVEVGYRSAVEALEEWFNNKEIPASRKPISNRRG